jgi:hypothetical protein
METSMKKFLGVSTTLALLAGPALSDGLVDGYFSCSIGSFNLGEIAIANGQFAGPVHDRAFENWYPVTVDGPTIIWGGPLGGISSSGQIVSTVLGRDHDDRVGFDITIQNTSSGNFQTITCSPEE